MPSSTNSSASALATSVTVTDTMIEVAEESQPLRVFYREDKEDCFSFHLKLSKLNKTKRMKTVMEGAPVDILKLQRGWTTHEWTKSDFTDLTKKEARIAINLPLPGRNNLKSWLLSKYIPPQQNIAAGHGPDMLLLQKFLLDDKVKKEYLGAQLNRNDHLKRSGTAFDASWATQPTHTFGLSQASIKLPANSEVVKAAGRIVKQILEANVPEYKLDFLRRDWIHSVSATYGNEDQHYHTSIQINVSIQDVNGDNLCAAIGQKGRTHIDANDVPYTHTVILFLSHSNDPEFFYGRFVQIAHRLACPSLPYGALIQSSKHPHCGYGSGIYEAGTPRLLRDSYPEGLELPKLPEGLEGKLNVVSYARNDCFHSAKVTVLPDVFTDKALPILGTQRNMFEFRMRHAMKKRDKHDARTAEQWVSDASYTWIEDGKRQTPRLSMAVEMLREDKAADALVKRLNNSLLARGVGKSMPKGPVDPNAPVKRKTPPSDKDEMKIQCNGMTTAKAQCKEQFKASRWDTPFCGRHQLQTVLFKDVQDNSNRPAKRRKTAK